MLDHPAFLSLSERSMTPPDAVKDLVERFTRNRDAYESSAYNEMQLRTEFIDPLFEALGWDIHNRQGNAEQYKDVVHEDSIKIGGYTKAPDYCFRIGGTRKFFVEAKKPSVPVTSETDASFQLRRYAWSAKLPLSILTNFKDFAAYDCRVRPAPVDKPSVARTLHVSYQDYLTRWEEISSLFSREAVLKGAFDKYAEASKGKRGTAEVDDAFLEEIDQWRDVLAHNVALRNEKLSLHELNFAVQRTIDRIIFLRICEDRGVEPYGQLQGLQNGARVYARLRELFYRADDRYNSGLFHFNREKDREEAPDNLTPGLHIDDEPLKEIIGGLYYPESPYEFSVLPGDILGQVYEQFLGKVIRLTKGHRAVVEYKPEVKKAGGVYYTPSYIVSYIVDHSLGTIIEGKAPKDVSKIHVLDPACGSGSFLLGAYERLLDWHRDYYLDRASKHRGRELYEARGGEWRLSTAEKKRILLNNIFGVDVDPQAVEVTKLSLLLRVLEGESEETIAAQLKLFHERALPDLGKNIKCGNSLIASDFFEDRQIDMLGEDDRYRINAFDWDTAFPDILRGQRKGFDVVIGNPPYVLLQTLDQPDVFRYLRLHYKAATYKVDTYQVFLERGIRLTAPGGRLGYITPTSYLRNKHAQSLREFILKSADVNILRAFYYPVFKASVDTSIIVLTREPRPSDTNQVQVVRSYQPAALGSETVQPQSTWMKHPEHQFSLGESSKTLELAAQFEEHAVRLGSFATAYFGIQTHDRARYVSDRRETNHHKPVIDGANISRYVLRRPSEFVDFRPPAIKSGGQSTVYEQDRIVVRQVGEVPIATLAPRGVYSLNTIYNIFFTKPTDYSLHFVLGVLCSTPLQWYWRQTAFDEKRTFPKIKKQALLAVPIPELTSQ